MKLSQINKQINQRVGYYEEGKWTYEQTLVALAEFKYSYTEETTGGDGDLGYLIDAAMYRVIQHKAKIQSDDTETSSSSSSSSY